MSRDTGPGLPHGERSAERPKRSGIWSVSESFAAWSVLPLRRLARVWNDHGPDTHETLTKPASLFPWGLHFTRKDQEDSKQALEFFVPERGNHLVAPILRYKAGSALLVQNQVNNVWIEMSVESVCEPKEGALHKLVPRDVLREGGERFGKNPSCVSLPRVHPPTTPDGITAKSPLSVRSPAYSHHSNESNEPVWVDLQPFNHCALRLANRSLFEDEVKRFRVFMKARYLPCRDMGASCQQIRHPFWLATF